MPVRGVQEGGMNREWMTKAACRGMDTEKFFPDKPGVHGAKQAKEAMTVCAVCPVVVECGLYREATGSAFGVWGGRRFSESSLGVSAVRGQYKKRGAA